MEDSFRVRVDRIFGSLSSSSSSSSSSFKPLWCLTDEELEKKEWNRDRGSPEAEEPSFPPISDGFSRFPQNRRRELEKDVDDDDEPFSGPSSGQPRQLESEGAEDEWEIRSSIGMDCTLDREEEEDVYDKVAVGKENSGDRLFMRDVNDYDVGVNSYNVLPDNFKEVSRDPRANLLAASVRLKEDADTAKNFNSLQVSDKTVAAVADAQGKTSEDDVSLKPILKRKEHQACTKSEKRVRFGDDCKIHYEVEFDGGQEKDAQMEISLKEDHAVSNKELVDPRRVPDYLRNPSRYTCYTLDSASDVDDTSNRKACLNFLDQLKKSKGSDTQLEDTPFDLPKSITFTPKKKRGDILMVDGNPEVKHSEEDVQKEPMQRKGLPISIAAGDAQEDEACMMEEDDPDIVLDKGNSRKQRAGRQYRSKDRSEVDDCDVA